MDREQQDLYIEEKRRKCEGAGEGEGMMERHTYISIVNGLLVQGGGRLRRIQTS